MKLIQHEIPLRRALPMLVAATCTTQAEPASLDHEVKASYLLNLLRFIDWPHDAPGSDQPLNMCVCGAPSVDAFYALHGARVRDHTISVRRVKDVTPARLGKCHLLFISADKPVVSVPLDRGLLTVGESEGFTARSGIVNLLLIDGRIRLEVNDELARLCGFTVDPRLAKLRMPWWRTAGVR